MDKKEPEIFKKMTQAYENFFSYAEEFIDKHKARSKISNPENKCKGLNKQEKNKKIQDNKRKE